MRPTFRTYHAIAAWVVALATIALLASGCDAAIGTPLVATDSTTGDTATSHSVARHDWQICIDSAEVMPPACPSCAEHLPEWEVDLVNASTLDTVRTGMDTARCRSWSNVQDTARYWVDGYTARLANLRLQGNGVVVPLDFGPTYRMQPDSLRRIADSIQAEHQVIDL